MWHYATLHDTTPRDNVILHEINSWCIMPTWQFLDYITEKREWPIGDWYGSLGVGERAEFDVLIDTLAETEDWDERKPKYRKYKELEKRHAGLCELILKVGKKNLRPIGVLRRDRREFILLNGCEKHTFWTVPPGAFDTALRLKSQLEQGRGTTRAHI